MNGTDRGDVITPAVTCVIPTHYRDVVLRRALASVAAQTEQCAEIIVIDDTGSATTKQIVNDFSSAQLPVRWIDASGLSPKGASSSRNLGASLVRTQLLAFLDDDDEWDATFIASCRTALIREGSDLAIAWTRLRFGETVLPHMRVARNPLASDALGANPGITGSNVLYRSEAFAAVNGFDTTLWAAEDQDLLHELLLSGYRVSAVQSPLVTQHADGAGHLSSPSARHAQGVMQFMVKHRSRLNMTQRLYLRRWYHRASRYAEQPRSRRLFHTAWQLALTPPSDVARSVARRLRKNESGPYG